jgi:hypothetical protein
MLIKLNTINLKNERSRGGNVKTPHLINTFLKQDRYILYFKKKFKKYFHPLKIAKLKQYNVFKLNKLI